MSFLTRPNWTRPWRRMRAAVFGQPVSLPAWEDPENLLADAGERMRHAHNANRERAVEVFTQRNNLEQIAVETRQRVERLHEEARIARAGGDERLASRLLEEKSAYGEALQTTHALLERAVEISAQVRSALQREDERIRRKTAQALALRTQWKLIQVEYALTLSLAELSVQDNQSGGNTRVVGRHRRSRELVIEAMTQKGEIDRLAIEARGSADLLQKAVKSARDRGDDLSERELLRDLEQIEATLLVTDTALAQAVAMTDQARTLVTEEWERLERLGIPTGPVACAPRPSLERTRRRSRRVAAIYALAVVCVLLVVALLFL